MPTTSKLTGAAARPGRGPARLVCAILIVVALAAVGFVLWMPAKPDETPPPEVVPVNVELLRVEPVPELEDTFDLTAVVEPYVVVEVAAEVAGRIERFGQRAHDVHWRDRVLPAGSTIDEGEPVAAGDPLVYLNKDLLQAAYDRALAQSEYEEREYQRLLDLFERGSTSKTELDDAITRRAVARATLDEAARALARTPMGATLDGIVNRLPVEVGEYATAGQVVAEIVEIDRVKVVVDVPERDVHYLAVGQQASVIYRTPDPAELKGEITYISELADEDTRTSRLEITLNNAEHTLRSGQIVRARLSRGRLENVIMIPLAAVIPLEKGHVVYVADEHNVAQRRDVELGFIKGRDVRVVQGLAPGDRLIIKGHRYVGPGQPVVDVGASEAATSAPAAVARSAP